MTLKEHTVKSYDKDLETIARNIDHMLELVSKSIDMVSSMIDKHNKFYVDEIKAHDQEINALDFLTERKVTAMLAMRQPMAVDLRYIVSALKVSSNLERIGDQAKGVIKKINRIGESGFDNHIKKSLLDMSVLSQNMLKESVIAFNDQSFEKAESVLKKDDEIDSIYSNLFKIMDKESFDKQQIERIVSILFIAKSLERIADHATNIAEITKYVVSGEIK